MDIIPSPPETPLSLPLPLYSTVFLGTGKSRDGEMFSLLVGCSETHARELKKHSLNESDEALDQYTSDRKRFGEGSYETWYTKGRTPFVLLHQPTETLAALTWFGPKPLGRKSEKHLSAEEFIQNESAIETEGWHSMAFRSYPPFRGKGLMKPFARFAMDMYRAHYPDARLWAGIHAANEASAGLAAALGFQTHKEASDPEKNFLVMVKE